LDFYSAKLKQQSANRHIAPLGHIILIPSQPVFALSPSPYRVNLKTIKLVFVASLVLALLRRKSKDWLARNQNNVSQGSDMPIRGLLFQFSTIKIRLNNYISIAGSFEVFFFISIAAYVKFMTRKV
jgi:hypothetical protein